MSQRLWTLVLGLRARRADRRVRRSGRWPTTRELFFITLLNGLTLAVAVLHRRQRLHAGVRPDAQRQPGARLALPARRLCRLHRRRARPARGCSRVAAGFLRAALVGLLMQVASSASCRARTCARRMVTIGLSIVLADLLLWIFGGADPPVRSAGAGCTARSAAAAGQRLLDLPAGRCWPSASSSASRLWLVPEPHARRHDDPRRRRRPRHARGLRRQRATWCSRSPSRSAPAWPASAAWSAHRAVDGARRGHALPARLAGRGDRRRHGQRRRRGDRRGADRLAEQFGLAYAPTYSVVFTFVILVLVLAFRPRGILGRRA